MNHCVMSKNDVFDVFNVTGINTNTVLKVLIYLSVCGSGAGPAWSPGGPPPSPSSCCTCWYSNTWWRWWPQRPPGSLPLPPGTARHCKQQKQRPYELSLLGAYSNGDGTDQSFHFQKRGFFFLNNNYLYIHYPQVQPTTASNRNNTQSC